MEKFECIGIVGGGKMGTDIFNYLSQFPLQIIWINRSNAEKSGEKYHRKLKRELKNEIISTETYNFRSKNHLITNEKSAVYNCDLIIESITENLYAKKQLIARLLKDAKKEAVIATNSSSFLPTEIITENNGQERIIGLHFFYPLGMKNIVELITTKQTDPNTKKLTKNFLSSIKMPVLMQDERSAFMLNRIMLDVQAAAFNYTLNENCSFNELDSVVKKEFCPIGIFEMMDHIGLDLIYSAAQNYMKYFENKEHFSQLISYLKNRVEKKEVGIKSQMGFYNYQETMAKKNSTAQKEQTVDFISTSFTNAYYSALKNYSIDKQTLDYGIFQYLDSDVETWLK